MFSEIAEIKLIREQKSRLSEREKELTEPTLTDLDMVKTLYELFKESLAGRDCSGRAESTTQRKKFIFIVLFLFSPSTLAGGRISNKIRKVLSEVIGCTPSYISHNVENVIFFYQQYKDFRQDVDWVFTEMMKRIKPGG